MTKSIMNAKDTVSAKLAECYVTVDGNRYNFMQAIKLEAKVEKTKTEVPILGKTGKGNKSTGWKGSGSATFHYNTSIFRELLERYKRTGEDVYFDIEVTNEDPTSIVILTAASLQNLMPTVNTLTRIWTLLLRILKFLTNSTSLQECKQNNYRGADCSVPYFF